MSSIDIARLSVRRWREPRLVLFRKLHRLAADRVVAAQWKPDPVVRHQDARQLGVAVEDDAEHVERLALVPVGGRKEVLHRINRRRVAVDECTDAKVAQLFHVAQLVHDLEARGPLARRVSEVVDAGEKYEQPVAVLFQGGKRLAQARRGHGYPFVAGADAFFGYELFGDHCRGMIPWAL